MRLATLVLLAALLAPPVLAQGEPVPDTTAPWRYFPLQVGNRWEYDRWETIGLASPFVHKGYDRWMVTGQQVLAGRSYFTLTTSRFDLSGIPVPGFTRTDYVRFDTTQAMVVRYSSGAEVPVIYTPCALDGPFVDSPGTFCGGGSFRRAGLGYDQTVLGTATSVKRFRHVTEVDIDVAAGIGFVHELDNPDKGSAARIDVLYARVGDRTYGTSVPVLPVVVAAEPEAPPAALALTASPNPSAGPLTLSLHLPTTSAVTIEAFDALGRRVYHEARALAAGTHALFVDASAWAPGLYVVRATTADGTAAVRVVRR